MENSPLEVLGIYDRNKVSYLRTDRFPFKSLSLNFNCQKRVIREKIHRQVCSKVYFSKL